MNSQSPTENGQIPLRNSVAFSLMESSLNRTRSSASINSPLLRPSLEPTRISVYSINGSTNYTNVMQANGEIDTTKETDFKDANNQYLYTEDDLILPTKLETKIDSNKMLFETDLPNYLVINSSGKPVYSRYGDENKLSENVGFLQAVIENYKSFNEELKSIKINNVVIAFKSTSAFHYVIIFKSKNISDDMLNKQLKRFILLMDSLFTHKMIAQIYKNDTRTDIRRIINRTMIDCGICRINSIYPSFLFNAINIFPISPSIQNNIKTSINEITSKNLFVNTWFVAQNFKIICMSNENKRLLNVISIILNIINYGSLFQNTQQTWFFPVLLPDLSTEFFTHVFVSCIEISQNKKLHLILLTQNKSKFPQLIELKEEIIKKIKNDIELASEKPNLIQVFGKSVGGLRHFYLIKKDEIHLNKFIEYKSNLLSDRKILRKIYCVYERIFFELHINEKQWVIETYDDHFIIMKTYEGFTLYACFSHFLTKQNLKSKCEQIVNWCSLNKVLAF